MARLSGPFAPPRNAGVRKWFALRLLGSFVSAAVFILRSLGPSEVANSHTLYLPAPLRRFVRFRYPYLCCGDSPSSCQTIGGRRQRCERHLVHPGNYRRAEVRSRAVATPKTTHDLIYVSSESGINSHPC